MSREAEQSVLGGLMLDNSKWPEVSNILTANDFFEDVRHPLIFDSIAALAAKSTPFDPVILDDHLHRVKKLEAYSYLSLLAGNVLRGANIIIFARIVRRVSLERQLNLAYDKRAGSHEIARLELALEKEV